MTVPDQVREIVETCLAKDPLLRPKVHEILRSCQHTSQAPNVSTSWLPRPIAAEIGWHADAVRPEPLPPRRPRLRTAALAAVVAIAAVAGFLVGSRQDHVNGSLQLQRETVPPTVNCPTKGRSTGCTGSTWIPTKGTLSASSSSRSAWTAGTTCIAATGRAAPAGSVTTPPSAMRRRSGCGTHSLRWRSHGATESRRWPHTICARWNTWGLRGNGFRLTAAADRTPRTFTLYVSVYQGRAKCSATLNDGSAAPIVDSSFDTFGTFNEGRFSAYTFTYQAATDGQALIVELTLDEDIGGGGNVPPFAATMR